MKECRGIWLPNDEVHFVEHLAASGEIADGLPAYQLSKLNAALEYVKQKRVAIDIGAHCGLWSMQLVKHFALVHAFEPVADHRACFEKNVPAKNYDLHAYALGDREDGIAMRITPSSSGDARVDGSGDIALAMLDRFDFEMVDLIKVDCVGYELFALKGAEQTLKGWKPVVIVEQKPGRAQQFDLPEQAALAYLQSLGAVLRREMSGNFIFTWD